MHENEEKQEILQRGGLQSRIQNGPRFFHQILRSQGLRGRGRRRKDVGCLTMGRWVWAVEKGEGANTNT